MTTPAIYPGERGLLLFYISGISDETRLGLWHIPSESNISPGGHKHKLLSSEREASGSLHR